jgi:hypothetical protein
VNEPPHWTVGLCSGIISPSFFIYINVPTSFFLCGELQMYLFKDTMDTTRVLGAAQVEILRAKEHGS